MRTRSAVSTVVLTLISDLLLFFTSFFRSRSALAAENLFLRKQLAFYKEHKVKSRSLNNGARWSLVFWSRCFDWKNALMIVKPETLIGWHRKGFQLFWRWKCQHGRPSLSQEIRELIRQMGRENPTWGQVRIASELSLKLGISISPRTVRKYWPWLPNDHTRHRVHSQSWSTFVRNHADAIIACDFMIAVTVRFQPLYVLLILELGSRRILHCNVTPHPTAEWTLQQFREALPEESSHYFLIHDRDAIFSRGLDDELQKGFGIKVLRTPPQSPQANAFCKRLVGTVRRECLDFLIPMNEGHLRRMLREWVRHYNAGRRGAMAVQEYKVKLVVHTDIVSIAPANDVDCTLFEVREAEDEVRILAGDGKLNVTDSHGTITVLPGEETVYGREGKKKGTPAPGNNPILDSPWAKVGGTAAAAGFLGFLAAHPEPKSISPFTP